MFSRSNFFRWIKQIAPFFRGRGIFRRRGEYRGGNRVPAGAAPTARVIVLFREGSEATFLILGIRIPDSICGASGLPQRGTAIPFCNSDTLFREIQVISVPVFVDYIDIKKIGITDEDISVGRFS